jgi:hypothetical protein
MLKKVKVKPKNSSLKENLDKTQSLANIDHKNDVG